MRQSTAWKEFESLVERIQRQLHPSAEITRNEHLPGHDSGTSREIDICIRYLAADISLLIVLDCKKRSRPVSVPEMQSFIGLMNDVRANAGIMVNEKGFSKGSRRIAARSRVELYTLLNTQQADWDCRVRIPICIEDWLLIPTEFQVRSDAITTEEVSRIRETARSRVRFEYIVEQLWREDCDRSPGQRLYDIEFAMDGEIWPLRVGFNAKVERYVRTGWLSLIGLTKISDGRTYSGEATVTMSQDPPVYHDHEVMVPPHEKSPHAIPARCISIGARTKIDLRDPKVTLKITLSGKQKPLCYEFSPAQASKRQNASLRSINRIKAE